MRTLAAHHPVAAAAYFLAVAGIAMFCMDPVVLGFSLVGALLCQGMLGGFRERRGHLFTLVLFLGMALINPIFSHNGRTVLFVMNHNPVALEALLYGIAAAAMVVAVLYWFRCFSAVMTSDRLLCLFGALSPKLSLLLSMTLRYVPLFGQQVRRVRQSQTALGLYKEENIIDRFRGGVRVFSVMVTWTLENGIITADSMTARGYGIGRRTQFSAFRWTRGDTTLLALTALLAALAALAARARGFAYYPGIAAAPLDAFILAGYGAYALLAFLPAILHGKEALKWRCLRSKI